MAMTVRPLPRRSRGSLGSEVLGLKGTGVLKRPGALWGSLGVLKLSASTQFKVWAYGNGSSLGETSALVHFLPTCPILPVLA